MSRGMARHQMAHLSHSHESSQSDTRGVVGAPWSPGRVRTPAGMTTSRRTAADPSSSHKSIRWREETHGFKRRSHGDTNFAGDRPEAVGSKEHIGETVGPECHGRHTEAAGRRRPSTALSRALWGAPFVFGQRVERSVSGRKAGSFPVSRAISNQNMVAGGKRRDVCRYVRSVGRTSAAEAVPSHPQCRSRDLLPLFFFRTCQLEREEARPNPMRRSTRRARGEAGAGRAKGNRWKQKLHVILHSAPGDWSRRAKVKERTGK